MPFDRSKVQFTEEDLSAAEALDRIYEVARGPREGSIFEVIISEVGDVREIFSYLIDESGDRNDLADRLVALGMMIWRDNVDLSKVTAENSS